MLTIVASGDVSNYADTSSLRQKIATAAGVDASLVTISVKSASVIITATIAVPATTTAAAVQSTVSSNLGTTAAASAALGITVEAVPTIAVQAGSGGAGDGGGGNGGAAKCDEYCRFSGDSHCDDGGPGASFAYCPLGTDCLDCGARPYTEAPQNPLNSPAGPPAPPRAPSRALLGEAALVTSTCNSHFNTPCSIQAAHAIVEEVAVALAASTSEALDLVADGRFNRRYSFWPTILNSSGAVVASGRQPRLVPDARNTSQGHAYYGFRAYVGVNFEQAESEEAGVSQSGLFSRIVAAADGDGYFGHLSHDLYPGHGRGPPLHHPSTRDVVPRIGIVRREGSGTDALYVLSSFRYAPPAPDALCLTPVLGPWT